MEYTDKKIDELAIEGLRGKVDVQKAFDRLVKASKIRFSIVRDENPDTQNAVMERHDEGMDTLQELLENGCNTLTLETLTPEQIHRFKNTKCGIMGNVLSYLASFLVPPTAAPVIQQNVLKRITDVLSQKS